MLIFVEQATPRLQYIFDFIFDSILSVSFRITSNLDDYRATSDAKFCYAQSPVDDGVFVQQTAGLLFETSIHRQNPYTKTITWNAGLPAFFQAAHPQSCLSFDIFSASFYLVTRYEEYLPFTPDQHGRFVAKESLAFRYKFLHLPVIDHWTYRFYSILQQHFNSLPDIKKHYRFVPTLDIDNAFAYRHKGLLRTVGALGKSLLKADFRETWQRLGAIMRIKTDKYDTFTLQRHAHQEHNVHPLYFFLLGKYNKYDTNISVRNLYFRKFITAISQRYQVGIHPSYQSNRDEQQLKKEIAELESITGKPIRHSRQHFLILSLPETYNRLIRNGIRHDYSMGYASAYGFRASTSHPFRFFNLKTNELTPLTIHPFPLMDVMLNNYLQLTPAQARQKIQQIIAEIQAVNGVFYSLWHNESLCNTGRWNGWAEVYKFLLQTAVTEKKR